MASLFICCRPSGEDIPEPDYNPYVLKPPVHIIAKKQVIKRDTMPPPDTIRVRGQWKVAKTSDAYSANSPEMPPPVSLSAIPVAIEMSEFDAPDIVQATGYRYDVSLPAGIPARGSVDGSGKHYLRLLNQKLGLNNNWISSMLQDRLGRIWIGTQKGISIWDGNTLVNLTQREGFPIGRINDMLEDTKGNIWIAIYGFGILVANGEEFLAYTTREGLTDKRVTSLVEDRTGNIWIGTENGLNVWREDRLQHYSMQQGLVDNNVRDLAMDQEGKIWIGTWGGGISIWNRSAFLRLTDKEGLPGNYITKLFQDSQSNMWIGTAGNGLVKWNAYDSQLFTAKHGPTAIAYPLEIIEDSNQDIWIGTNMGASVYNGEEITSRVTDGLKFTVVGSMIEDNCGQIWIGTTGGGIHLVTEPGANHTATNEFVWYFSGFLDLLEDSYGNMWVESTNLEMMSGGDLEAVRQFDLSTHTKDFNKTLYQDSRQNLIIGSIGIKLLDLARIDEQTVSYLHYKLDTTVCAETIGVNAILEDRNHNLWLGSNRDRGILFWDRTTETEMQVATILQYSGDQGINTNFVRSMTEDKEGRVWVGSHAGLLVLSGDTITQFTNDELVDGFGVVAMAMDREGKIWIATDSRGVAVYDGIGFSWFTEDQGLLSNSIITLHIDQQDRIWIGTETGLVKLQQESDGNMHISALNEYHGIDPGTISKITVDNENRLWATSQWNMDVIDLDQVMPDSNKPKLAILQVQPFHDQFDWRQVRRSLLSGENRVTGDRRLSLDQVKYESVYRFSNLPVKPEFPYNINHLTFQWSSTYWDDPTSIRYSYLLEGQDQAWSPLIQESSISFNNLEPGDYTLKVRAVAGNARWSDTASYSFTINPPLWATWWAYALYMLCAMGLVLTLRYYERKRFMLKQKARSLEDLDRTKSEFFTNISHELRTPLTLILGPLKALQQGTYKGDVRSLYSMMSQNGRGLLRLVDQLLDLSKLDRGNMDLDLQDCHINELVRLALSGFDSACSMKNIELELCETEEQLYGRLDQEKLRQVLYNLVSNAIKFTPEGGHIRVSVKSVKQQPGENQQWIQIEVKDSGIGIAKEEQEYIFDRFYQVKRSPADESEGTGIGLALAKKLVQLHDGNIEVESEPGWGSSFTITLPLVRVEQRPPTTLRLPTEPTIKQPRPHTRVKTHTSNTTPTLLLVEDNAHMRQYIKSCLGGGYHYLEASNGEVGLQLVEEVPDLILCDVMMPKMDGYQFCERIRQRESVSHIPFIFLSARADPDSLLRGLNTGSDDYITKPFEAEELCLRVGNHLNRMERYRSFFNRQLVLQGDIVNVESLDTKFLNTAIQLVQEQMRNSDFTVGEFARLIGMSKTQLYRKLLTLTGQSPSVFIRSIRLKRAAQLIVQGYGNTSDVAYAVGFNNLSYFAKCFKELFGTSPSHYRMHSITK